MAVFLSYFKSSLLIQIYSHKNDKKRNIYEIATLNDQAMTTPPFHTQQIICIVL